VFNESIHIEHNTLIEYLLVNNNR